MLNPISFPLPTDILNLILEYDGRIKYIHKERIYVNIISKLDERYNLLSPIMIRKNNLEKQIKIGNNGLKFYIEFYYKNDEIYKGLVLLKKLL